MDAIPPVNSYFLKIVICYDECIIKDDKTIQFQQQNTCIDVKPTVYKHGKYIFKLWGERCQPKGRI